MQLVDVVNNATKAFESYDYARALQITESFFWSFTDDYVELISDLIREVGEARQVDMAARLGVSQPTVAKMLKRLASVG